MRRVLKLTSVIAIQLTGIIACSQKTTNSYTEPKVKTADLVFTNSFVYTLNEVRLEAKAIALNFLYSKINQ